MSAVLTPILLQLECPPRATGRRICHQDLCVLVHRARLRSSYGGVYGLGFLFRVHGFGLVRAVGQNALDKTFPA